MNKHTVFVAGKHFVLLSDDKDNYVQNLANEVNETISRISVENPSLDRRAASILCALNYADDLKKESARNKSMSEKAQPLITQADKQAKQLKELKEKLAEKDSEIESLKKELKDLRISFEKSTHVLDGAGMTKQAQSEPQQSGKKKPHKGYRPMRQYSLFDNEK